MNNNSTSKPQELAGVSPINNNNNSRNSWAPQHERRKSIRLLGNVVELDEWLDWRVKWGQRVTVVCSGVATLLYFFNNYFFGGNNALAVPFIVSAVAFVIGVGTLYYKNVSVVVAWRLLKEVNVVMI